ncbi:MAG: transcription elongation factor Spt5 [Acidilobaceae archaeon]
MSAGESRFYAIQVTGGMEERVALIIVERAKSMGFKVRSVLVPVDSKGFLVVEVENPGVLFHVTRGIRHVKRKRPILVKEEEVVRLARPIVEVPKLSKGQLIEVIGGPFKGMKGKVIEVHEARGEVDVALLEADYRMIVTIPLDLVKLVEEKTAG